MSDERRERANKLAAELMAVVLSNRESAYDFVCLSLQNFADAECAKDFEVNKEAVRIAEELARDQVKIAREGEDYWKDRASKAESALASAQERIKQLQGDQAAICPCGDHCSEQGSECPTCVHTAQLKRESLEERIKELERRLEEKGE